MAFNLDHWTEVAQSLRRNRLRTILTACGIFWGIFMLVMMLGFGNGLERAVLGEMGHFAKNAVFVWPERTSKAYKGRQPGRRIELREDDAAAITSAVRGVELVVPRNHLGGWGSNGQVSRKGKSDNFLVTGDLPEFLRLETMLMEGGRFLNPRDLSEYRKVAVIGARVRDTLFSPGEDPIGDSIKVGNIDFTVIGVYRSPAAGPAADWQNGRIFVPRTTFGRAFATGNRVDYLAVLVAPDRSAEDVEAEVRAVLKARHAVHPDDPRGLNSFNRAKEFRKFHGLFLGIGALTWIVGIVTLVAGAIGVSNIMMIAVAERTKEIGIRKAIGATPWSIMSQIVQEALVLTAFAGYAGLVAGVGVLEVIGAVLDRIPKEAGPSFFTRPEIDIGKALVAVGVLVVSGALAGLAPARSALAIRPVEALAHE